LDSQGKNSQNSLFPVLKGIWNQIHPFLISPHQVKGLIERLFKNFQERLGSGFLNEFLMKSLSSDIIAGHLQRGYRWIEREEPIAKVNKGVKQRN
jgi:hypothetical protein